MKPPPLTTTRRRLLIASAASVVAPGLRAQGAQDYPNKPIRIILPFTPGGTTDALARAIGQKLQEYWGQPTVVDNRPGAAGWLGITQMAKMPADGYTIGLTISNIIYAHALYNKLPFDIQKDFEPVSMISRSAVALAVSASFPANTLEEFIALVKKNPGKYSYASFGQGTSANIFGESLNLVAKLDLVHVPYKGAAPMVTDLLGGHVPAAISLLDGMLAHHRAGKLRVIGLFTEKRSPLMPDIPTFAEQGYKVTSGEAWTAMWAPGRTPAAEIERMQRALQKVLAQPALKELLTTRLMVQPAWLNGVEMAALQKAELAHWEPIIKASGFKPE